LYRVGLVKVIREKPCQRLQVTLETGESRIAANWSLGGLRLDGLASLPPVKSLLKLTLELPFQGFDISFDVQAEVVRHAEETSTIGVKFIKLSERAHDLMSHFIDDLVRGKMASVDDTICRIDIPVTPISTKPDPNPSDEMPGRRWPVKTIFFSAMYVVLGFAVFAYLSFLIYVNIMRLEISSAVVSAPLYAVNMPVDGEFIPVDLQQGMRVKQGQEIARIVNLKLENRIDELTVKLEARRRDLIRSEEKFRIEQNRLKLFQIIKSTDREIILAEENAAKANLKAKDDDVERMKMLLEKGLVEAEKLNKALQNREEAEGRLHKVQRQLEKFAALEAVSTRKHFHQKEFVLDLDLLALEVEKANSALRIVGMELEKYETKRKSLTLKAPYDGRVATLQIAHKAALSKGRHLLTLEKSIHPEITAFLDQAEIIHVGMHDQANVYIPSLDRHLMARVLAISRNTPGAKNSTSHYIWRGQKEKSASVTLGLELGKEDKHLVEAGLPAIVTFSKRSSSHAYSALKSELSDLDL